MSRIRTTRRDAAEAARTAPHHARAGRGGGQPLDHATRGYMEARFGHDFAGVRVHSGPDAARTADALDARAYTVGPDIYFGPGAFAPGTVGGAHLLAHELTHVVQQDRGGAPTHALSDTGDGAEVEAAHAADVVTVGGSVRVSAAPGAVVAREEKRDDGFMSTISGVSTLLGLPGKAGLMNLPFMSDRGEGGFMPSISDRLGFLGPTLGVMGTLGSTDKAFSGLADGDYLKAGSGFLGMGSGIGGLASWFGSDLRVPGEGNMVGGVSGLLGAGASALDAVSDFSNGNYGKGALDSTKAVSSSLSGLASMGGFSLSSVADMGAMEALAGGGAEGLAALGPAGAVLGAGLAGVGVGTYLSENTTVGEHSVGALGTIDGWLTGDGETSWVQRTADAAGEDWDKGDYLGAIGNGLELGGVGIAGAVGGLAGGAVDLVGDIGSGIGDLWDSIWD